VSGAAGAQRGAPPPMLPRLREDLSFSEGARSAPGERQFLIYDALRHRYIGIDGATFYILSQWRRYSSVADLVKGVMPRLGPTFDAREIEKLVHFLDAHDLVEGSARHEWQKLSDMADKKAHGWVMTLVHHYLFFRIPLLNPEPFLLATRGLVEPLFYRRVQLAILALGVLGLYLVSRQWDVFIQQAVGLATLQGAAAFGVTLFGVKALHELAHGYAAVRFGCRVPAMGLAFMMMAPLLYTDVTDAWRLSDRRQRLVIDAAGVAFELGLACLATLVWVFLPDGLTRQIAFLIATTSWIMSLTINLNPFMRFDGYYILADVLGVPNLQTRAFELGRWQLREFLFRPRLACPETMVRWKTNFLIVYAWAVWIYRLFLFIGIAALVYHYFFKALGVALFCFEIGYFVIKPIVGEMMQWWKLRQPIVRSGRIYGTLAVVLGALGLFVVPWSSVVQVPAVLEAANVARVFPPRPARVVSVHVKPGQVVAQGDVLVRLDAPEISNEQVITQARYESTTVRLNRQLVDRDDRNEALVLESTKTALVARLEGLARERAELEIRAPIAGAVGELNPMLHAGRWLGVQDMIALIRSETGARAVGYLAEADLWRVDKGARGRFVPEVALASAVDVVLTDIAISSAATLAIGDLAHPNGGPIDVQSDTRKGLIAMSAQYPVTLAVEGASVSPAATQRGRVHLTGRAESAAAALWRQVLRVLVRESGA
jgi:putative peptide zinc metalloprotease protein